VRTSLHAPRSRKSSILAASLGALALLGSLLVATPAQALSDTGTGGVFVPTTGRILDTGKNIGGYSTAMPAKTWRSVKVAGNAGVPDDGSVGAVSVVATVADITAQGQLFGRPNADEPTTMMGIYGGEGNQNTSFSAVLAVNSDGTIQVQAETTARLILDVQGYYTANSDGTAPGGFVPLNGKRIVDTRSGLGATKATLASGDRINVQVTGTADVPAGASGVIVNLVAVNTLDHTGYLTPYAADAARPSTSLNYAAGVATSMQAQVKLSADGKITVYNSSSTTNLIVDVQGYFTAAGKGGASFTPGAGRAYDTRTGTRTPLAQNETRSIQVAGVAGVPVMGSGINAVVLTLSALKSTTGGGNSTVWADGTAKPNTTAINFDQTTIRTNTITVPLGANGKISLWNNAGPTDYVIDVQGWYIDPMAPSLTCGDAFQDGSWADALPDTITCTATATAASSTGEQLSINGEEGLSVPLSETGPTTTTLSITPTLGNNTVNAFRLSADGTPSASTMLTFGFGRWTDTSLEPFPSDGATMHHDEVELDAIPSEGGFLPDDATISYVVSKSPDMSNPTWLSEPTPGSVQVPSTAFDSQQQYYWTATARGAVGAEPEASVSSPVFTLVVDDSLPSENVYEGVMETMVGGGSVVKDTYLINKSSSKNYVKWSVTIGACQAPQNGSKCSVTTQKSKTQDIQTEYGLTKGVVAAKLSIKVSSTTAYSTTMLSPPMKAGQKYHCSPIGTLYKYKVQQKVWNSVGGYTYPTSGWKYTFDPYPNQISCKV
jgi:hypothetical protein